MSQMGLSSPGMMLKPKLTSLSVFRRLQAANGFGTNLRVIYASHPNLTLLSMDSSSSSRMLNMQHAIAWEA